MYFLLREYLTIWLSFCRTNGMISYIKNGCDKIFMKKQIKILLLAVVLIITMAWCLPEKVQENREKRVISQEPAQEKEETVPDGPIYHEDGTITLSEGYTAFGFYDIETGKIYDSGTIYPVKDKKITGRVSFQQNFPETRHYLFIAMVDYQQQEFVVEGEKYTGFPFELTGDTEMNFRIELDVTESAEEFSYIILPEPEEKAFMKDGEYQDCVFELQRGYVYRINLMNESGGQKEEPDETVESMDITDAQIPDGFMLTEKHDSVKNAIEMVVEGKSGEICELVISNKNGTADVEYVLTAFLNWKQIPLTEGAEKGYIKVPAGKAYVVPITLPEAEADSVYQIYGFGFPYGKLNRKEIREDPVTFRMVINPRK